ncbi:Plug domain-containing protein [Brevundimonas sp. LF-1]|uniref:Plug domain-containing protein n=1 Tax=Brevundimonas sp. LF-1 TaxID=3126100 RepID=UPI0030E56757
MRPADRRLPGALLAFAYDLPGADTPTVVDSIIVTGRRNAEDPAVVAEARDRLSRTPGAVAVVSAESYSDRFVQGFADTLRNVPGVLAQKRFGEESRLSIRGSGIAQGFHQRGVLFAQDGVPFADADGFSDFQSVDSSAPAMSRCGRAPTPCASEARSWAGRSISSPPPAARRTNAP